MLASQISVIRNNSHMNGVKVAYVGQTINQRSCSYYAMKLISSSLKSDNIL